MTIWILVLAAALVLALLGTPLFAILAGIGLVGLHLAETPLSAAIADVYRLAGPEAVSLSTIPLFTFAGYLMAQAKTATRLLNMAQALLGFVPGGLAVVTVLTCAFFTTFTGASGVTIVALGGLLLPALEKSGFGSRQSLGVVAGSGAIGLLFPPALPLIVYGIVFALSWGSLSRGGGAAELAEFSIDRFMFAGIVPGALLVIALSCAQIVRGVRARVATKPVDVRAFFRAVADAKWELPIPFIVIAGLATGLLTIPESAALTALYVLIVECLIYRDVSFSKDVPRVLRESMVLVGAIFMKIAGATILVAFFVDAGIPQSLFAWLQQYVSNKLQFLLLLNLVLLLVGCLMDVFSAIVVVVPLIAPAAAAFAIDPYHLGVVFLLNLEIGYLLPPAGLNLFIAALRFGRPLSELYRAAWAPLVIMFAVLLAVTYVPALVVLPR